MERCFREFEFSAAAQALYGFFWNDFCDWYVEVSKSKLQAPATRDNCLALQDLVLRQTLLLLHPFIPFITEELWQQLGYSAAGAAADLLTRDVRLETAAALAADLAARGLAVDPQQAESVQAVKTFVSQARALKAEHGLAGRRDARFWLIATDEAWAALEPALAKVLRLAGAEQIVRRPAVEGAPATVTPFGTLFLDLASTVDAGGRAHAPDQRAGKAGPAHRGHGGPARQSGLRRQGARPPSSRARASSWLTCGPSTPKSPAC